jgi:hypothetical protein
MQIFTENVAKERKRTGDTAPPVFSRVSLHQFWSLTIDDVVNAVPTSTRRVFCRRSDTDVCFQAGRRSCASFIIELFNRSLAAGHFLAEFKEAFITAVVKPGLNRADVNS